jgi:integrase
VKEYRVQIRSVFTSRIFPVFSSRSAASIATVELERFRDRLLADGFASATVKKTLSALSKLYNWSRREGLIECANPCSGVEHPRAARSIDYLDAREAAALLAHAEERAPSVFPMIAVAIYAGLRKGELYGLRWCDVHFDAARLDVMHSYRGVPKGGKARHLPMHAELVRILRAWRDRCPETSERLVFPIPDEQESHGAPRPVWCMGDRSDMRGLAELLKAAGCHELARPWHALRHTFASHFMMAGGNILALQKLLGHATIEMTMIYAHLAPDFMATEVARLAFPRFTTAEVIDFAAARAGADAPPPSER